MINLLRCRFSTGSLSIKSSTYRTVVSMTPWVLVSRLIDDKKGGLGLELEVLDLVLKKKS